eukprot:1160235-Pelagomonas_calceolata.AAC.11
MDWRTTWTTWTTNSWTATHGVQTHDVIMMDCRTEQTAKRWTASSLWTRAPVDCNTVSSRDTPRTVRMRTPVHAS